MARSIAVLQRAWLYRHVPFLFEGPGETLGVDRGPAVLVDEGAAAPAVQVLGRLHHAVQAIGLAGGEEWTISASLDGAAYAPVGDPITEDAIVQLPDGLYGFLKAEQTDGDPGSARLILASAH